jgi:uncharacterized protein (TIGR02145 family)
MSKIGEARIQAAEVRDEVRNKRNTPIRVGSALMKIIDSIYEMASDSNSALLVRIDTQTDLDAWRPESGFAIVTMTSQIDQSVRNIFGDDSNKIEMHCYSVAGTGTDAGSRYQEGVSALDGKKYRRFYVTVGAYWTDFEINDFEQTLDYYGNWSSAIPTYYPNLMYKYRGELYIPTVQHSESLDPFTDTTNWKAITSVIGRNVILQSDLDEFSVNPHNILIDRSNTLGTSDISLPSNVVDEYLIVRNYSARTLGLGGNVYIQEFTDGNAMQYKRTAYWLSGQGAGYYWKPWVCENEIPVIESYTDLVGFHKKIKNNKFVSSKNAVAHLNTGQDATLINQFGENLNLIVTAKMAGSYPGPTAGDMIYEVANNQGIKRFALYTGSPESLSSFSECPVFTTQYELDNFKPDNGFARVGNLNSMKPFFGTDFNGVIVRSYRITSTGTGAGDWAQEATNYLGKDYIRYYYTVGAYWSNWTWKLENDIKMQDYQPKDSLAHPHWYYDNPSTLATDVLNFRALASGYISGKIGLGDSRLGANGFYMWTSIYKRVVGIYTDTLYTSSNSVPRNGQAVRGVRNTTTAESLLLDGTILKNCYKDFDGNWYSGTKIGTQVWQRENLQTTCLEDGTPIPLFTKANWQTAAGTEPLFGRIIGIKEDAQPQPSTILTDADVVKMYGYLYSSDVACNANLINSNGWRVCSYTDWTTLTSYITSLGLSVPRSLKITTAVGATYVDPNKVEPRYFKKIDYNNLANAPIVSFETLASKTITLSSVTIATANWTWNGSVWVYTITDLRIKTTHNAEIIPMNQEAVVLAADIQPYSIVSNGSIVLQANYKPSADFLVTILLRE